MARQRGRVVLRRIEDRRRRGICFRKRRAGLVKKAEELAVLCDADVGLLVINPFDGTFQRFAAPATRKQYMVPGSISGVRSIVLLLLKGIQSPLKLVISC
uniref:Agamous-like MADS-box protein AGL21 n=1 Tax=Aegilops tauschii TaxID=37682 RepID=M8BRT0_AEGTA